MQLLLDAYSYFLENQARFWEGLGRHLNLSLSALAISVLVGLPLGIWIATAGARGAVGDQLLWRIAAGAKPGDPVSGAPLPGHWLSASAVRARHPGVPPVIINTYAGIRSVDPAIVEAAYGMGMQPSQVLRQIELPLALPAMIAGIRTAAVEVVASATLAAFIGGGGLGRHYARLRTLRAAHYAGRCHSGGAAGAAPPGRGALFRAAASAGPRPGAALRPRRCLVAFSVC